MKHFSEISASAERVVDAAEGLIQQRGYNGFSYDDVAKLVNIKKPSIHHHFATKSELVTVVTQRYTARFCAQLQQIEAQHGLAAARLKAYAALFEQTFINDQRLCLCGILGAESGTLPAEVVNEIQLFFTANLDWLNLIIKAGQGSGQIQSQLPATALAQAYLCLLEGAMLVGRTQQSNLGPAAVGATFLQAILASPA